MINPEFELLLSLARTVPDRERVETIVTAGVDWRLLLNLATKHRVRPMVYKSLFVTCWDWVPEDVRNDWEDTYRAITGRNRFAIGELLRINSAFRNAGLALVSLKGPAMAEVAYGDSALREFGDLDLLVRVDDFRWAIELLKQLGYRPVWEIDPDLAMEFLKLQGEFTLVGSFGGPEIDLHWRVATTHTAYSLEADYFWPRFQPLQIDGDELLSFSSQDLPLYLASQGGHDQWSDLRRLCDLAEFLRRHPELDWEQLIRTTIEFHGLRVLLIGLRLAHELLGTEAPDSLARWAQEDAALPKLVNQAIEKLTGRRNSDAVSQFIFQFQAKERWREKLGLVAGRFTDRTDSDGMWALLPKPVWGLYTILRPFRLLYRVLSKGDVT